jgi:hypothetical protein
VTGGCEALLESYRVASSIDSHTPDGPANECDYSTIMSNSENTVGIFTTDADLALRSWDGWLTQVTGISPADAHGRPLIDLFPDLETRNMVGRFKRVLTEGRRRFIISLSPAPLLPLRGTTTRCNNASRLRRCVKKDRL